MREIIISTNRFSQRSDHFERILEQVRGFELTIIYQGVLPQLSAHKSRSGNRNRGFRVHSYDERGLSRSRNRAIELLRGNIGLLSDDDVSFLPGLRRSIVESFQAYPQADIVCFQAKCSGGRFLKKYPSQKRWMSKLDGFRVSSIEIAFRVESIKKSGVRYDENFGLGSRFGLGEEAIFIADAIECGLRALYLPIPIVQHPFETTGKDHSEINVVARGAQLCRIFGGASFLWMLLFALKKRNEYRTSCSFARYLSLLLRGGAEYRMIAGAGEKRKA